MARYRYTSYQARRRRSLYIRYSVIAGVIIIGAAIVWRGRDKNGEEIAPLPPEDEVVLTHAPMVDLELTPEDISTTEADIEPVTEPVVELPEPVITVTESDLPTSPEASALIAEAFVDSDEGRIIAARDKLNRALIMALSDQDRASVKARLSRLSSKWLFSRDPYAGDTLTGTHKVQTGEMLITIAKQYKVPHEILQKVNNIKRPELLPAGATIKIINGPFHAIVYRSTFTMDLYLGNKTYVKSYKIGIGEEGKETPTGKWRVKTNGKLESPPWPNPEGGIVYPGDPEYPLGSRWIGLDGIDGDAKGRVGFGLHGTKEPETIGQRSSQGCIRLYNGDVIEFYDLVMPGISEVRVVEK